MRLMSIMLALGAALAICPAAEAHRHYRKTLVRVPVVTAPDSYWVPDFNVVPRYRYRPEDDRVDTSPNAPPVARGEPEAGQVNPGY